MKNKFCLLLFALLFSAQVFSQSYDWIRGVVGPGTTTLTSAVLDSKKNAYYCGTFTVSAKFGHWISYGNAINAYSSDIDASNMYLLKYDSLGAFQWARKIGNKYGSGYGVTIDEDDNLYVAGTASWCCIGNTDTVRFDAVSYKLKTKKNAGILAKYDSNGNYIWSVLMNGNSSLSLHDVKADKQGSVYVAGVYVDTLIFQSDTIIASSPNNTIALLIKYDVNGNRQYIKQIPSATQIEKLAIDNAGNVYCYGNYIQENLDLGGGHIFNASGPNTNIFLAKYDPSGNITWGFAAVDEIGVINNRPGGGLALDEANNCYITGSFTGPNVEIGDSVFTSTAGTSDVFLARINADGTFGWAAHPGSSGANQTEFGTAVHVNSSGHVFLAALVKDTAYFENYMIPYDPFRRGNGVLAKYDSLGNFMWLKTYGNVYPNGAARGIMGWDNKVIIAGYMNTDEGDIMFDANYFCATSDKDYLDGFTALVNDCNATLSQAGGTLSATAGSSYKWFLNGAEISGATQQNYTPVVNGRYKAEVTFPGGCKCNTATKTFTLSGTTNISNALNVAVSVFPNPCADELHLSIFSNASSQSLKIRIYNYAGGLIQEQSLTDTGNDLQYVMDVKGMTPGLYLLEISDSGKKLTQKFVKQ
jgi:hypothetical protein